MYRDEMQWGRLTNQYIALTKAAFDPLYLDVYEDDGNLLAATPGTPRVVVFRSAPPAGDHEIPEALLEAVYNSPIVMWTTADIPEESPVWDLLRSSWPRVQELVADARSSKLDPSHEHVNTLRMVWEDDEWLSLVRKIWNHD